MNPIYNKLLSIIIFIFVSLAIISKSNGQGNTLKHNEFTYTEWVKSKKRPLIFLGENSSNEKIFQSYQLTPIPFPILTLTSFSFYLKVYDKNMDYQVDLRSNNIEKKYARFKQATLDKPIVQDKLKTSIIKTKKGNYITAVSKNKKKRGKIYSLLKVNIENKTLENFTSLFELDNDNKEKRLSAINYISSPDTSKLLFFYKVKPSNSKSNSLFYKFLLFDDNFNLIFSKNISFGINSAYTNLVDANLTNAGNILVSIRIDNEFKNGFLNKSNEDERVFKSKTRERKEAKLETKRGKDGVTIHFINKESDGIIDFGLNSTEVFMAKFCNVENQNPIIFGLREGNFGENIEEAFFKIELSQDLEVLTSIGLENDEKIYEEDKKDGVGDLPSIIFQEILVDNEGNQYLILEDFSDIDQEVYKYTRDILLAEKNFNSNVYHHGNLTILKFKRKGGLIWKKVIYKYSGEQGYYLEPINPFEYCQFIFNRYNPKYKAFIIDNKLQIFFNDDARHNINSPIMENYKLGITKSFGTFRVKINEKGEIIKDLIGSYENNNYELPMLRTGIELKDGFAFACSHWGQHKKVKWCLISKN